MEGNAWKVLLRQIEAELDKLARYEAVVKAADDLFPLNVKELPESDPNRTDRMHTLWAAVRELRGNRGGGGNEEVLSIKRN